ncbi:MAG: hypothetical protein RLZZ350_2148 [Verrucomicrobiota bacterium]|jgi:peptidoglycan/LPS O-acetylase OafA/YrhL
MKKDSLPRIDCLDGIRALAALMVMAFHLVRHHGLPASVIKFSAFGQTGVDLFFVLSGFLITRILLLSKDSPHYFRTFYARRTLRIFPLYYGFLIIHFFVLPLVLGMKISSFNAQWWAWFYLQNLPQTFPSLTDSGPGHFWSLAVEEHFYLLWPLLVFVLSRRQFGWLLVATLVAPVLLRFWFVTHGIEVLYFTFTRADALGYGALLAWLLTGNTADAWRQTKLFRWLFVVLGVLLVPAFVLLSGGKFLWLQAFKLSLIPMFYFALIGFCIVDAAAAPLTRLFTLRWLRWLGGISYGLYVLHQLCFLLVARWLGTTKLYLEFPLALGATILAAYVSFHFFEAPILKLKRHFEYAPENPR